MDASGSEWIKKSLNPASNMSRNSSKNIKPSNHAAFVGIENKKPAWLAGSLHFHGNPWKLIWLLDLSPNNNTQRLTGAELASIDIYCAPKRAPKNPLLLVL